MSSTSDDLPLIRVDGLTMGWGAFVLQRDLRFEVRRGEVFAILGGSGCGKSTLLRHLVGLETPLAGSVHIEGPHGRRAAPELRTGPPAFGVMFQSGALFGSMTVGENVALPLRSWTPLPPEAVDVVVAARLRLVGLQGFENHYPAEISGGMKKRAAIARAMALEPALLFLDEPSAGLDPVTAVELDDLIKTLSEGLGLTVVIVTHELESIFRVVTRCIMLDKESRSVIAEGDPRALRDESQDPRVRAFFNRLAKGVA